MELVFSWVLLIGIPICLVLIFIKFKKRVAYKEGKKVANTGFLENTDLYRRLERQYKIYVRAAFVSMIAAIFVGFLLIARPAKIDRISPEIRNRDIFLCMDTSDSVDELNVKMCAELKKVVEELDGERFGITIFNAKSVLLVPLTSDYAYIGETLDKLEASFRKNIKGNIDFGNSDDMEIYNYKYDGTLGENGSSFIGDGLASCLYNFPDLETNDKRSRIIIFTTDNELNGVPYLSLQDAAGLCTKNNVRVFAIAPENISEEGQFKNAIESTGGQYYKNTQSKAYDKLVADIKKIKTSVMQTYETKITDQPKGLFIAMLLLISVYFICSRKAKL